MRSVDETGFPLLFPIALVRYGERVEVPRRGCRIVDPFAQQGRTVDHIDRGFAELIFIREIAPQRVIRIELADHLESERLKPPRLEGRMVIPRPLGVDHYTMAKLAG